MASESLIGNLAVLLSLETAAFEKGTTHAQKLMKQTQNKFEAMAGKMVSIGKGLTLGVSAPLVGFGALAVREATEAAKAMAQVDAALASMGPKAQRTAEQLKASADAMEMRSLYEGDEILTKVTANLLTFGNISGKVFDQAQQAIIDISTRMGSDLQGATMMVGKALNDPAKGLAALRRVGIQFTEAQVKQIEAMVKVGNAAGAQAIMLKELQAQFGGAAQAAQNTDPFNKAQDAFKQMAETVGTALLPIIPIFTDAIVKLASAFQSLSPETQKWVIIAGAAAALVGPLVIALGFLVSAIGMLLPVIIPVVAAIASFAAVIATAAIGAVTGLVVALGPLLIPLAALAAAIGAVYLVWKNWDKIKPILVALYNSVRTYLVDKLNAVWNFVKAGIDRVTGFFRGMWDAVVGHSYVPDMVDGISRHMQRLDKEMVDPAQKATKKTADAFRELQGEMSGLLKELFPDIVAFDEYQRKILLLANNYKKVGMSAETAAAATERLHSSYLDSAVGRADDISLTGTSAIDIDLMSDSFERLAPIGAEAFGGLSDRAKELQGNIHDVIEHGLKGMMRGFGSLKDIALDVLFAIGDAIIENLVTKMSQVGGGGGGLGGILGSIGNALGGLFKKPVAQPIGMASGGSGVFGGLGGTDRNILSFNGSPMAKVSRGENFSVSPANENQGGGNVINVYANDAVLAETVKGWVAEGMQMATGASVQYTNTTIKQLNRQRMG